MVAPDGRQSELWLDQVGPGRYEGLTALGPPGAYLVQVVQRAAPGGPSATTSAGGPSLSAAAAGERSGGSAR